MDQKLESKQNMKGESLVGNILGVFVAVLVGIQLLPVIQSTIHSSGINETQRTTVNVVPVLFAVALLVVIASAII